MPADRNVSARFVAQFLRGQKRLLKLSEVRWVSRVSGFRELSIRALYDRTTEKATLAHYLPEVTALSKLDRVYFLNVLSFRFSTLWMSGWSIR